MIRGAGTVTLPRLAPGICSEIRSLSWEHGVWGGNTPRMGRQDIADHVYSHFKMNLLDNPKAESQQLADLQDGRRCHVGQIPCVMRNKAPNGAHLDARQRLPSVSGHILFFTFPNQSPGTPPAPHFWQLSPLLTPVQVFCELRGRKHELSVVLQTLL